MNTTMVRRALALTLLAAALSPAASSPPTRARL
jgi:hypothetical protein